MADGDGWRVAAARLSTLVDALEHRVRVLAATWSGPAAAAFLDVWERWSAAVRDAAGEVRGGADGVDRLGPGPADPALAGLAAVGAARQAGLDLEDPPSRPLAPARGDPGTAALTGLAGLAAPAAPAAPLPVDLRPVLAHGIAVPSGRSYFSPQVDPWLAAQADRVPARQDRGVLLVHGDEVGASVAGRRLGAAELAALVTHDSRLAGRPLLLVACDAGRLDDGLGRQLARLLGVPVEAATRDVWIDADGALHVTDGLRTPGGWLRMRPDDGGWRTFQP